MRDRSSGSKTMCDILYPIHPWAGNGNRSLCIMKNQFATKFNNNCNRHLIIFFYIFKRKNIITKNKREGLFNILLKRQLFCRTVLICVVVAVPK